MRTRTVAVLILALAASFGARLAFAQTPAEPRTVSECLEAAQGYAGRRVQALRAAGQAVDYRKLAQEATEAAKQYAARFSIATVAPADLTSLARLYMLAKQPELAQQAIAKHLAAAGMSDGQRADALLAAVDISMASPTTVTEAGIRQAEAYAIQLDAVKGADVQQLQAHAHLGGYFRGVDVDDKMLEHGTAVIARVGALTAESKEILASEVAGAYTNVADVYAGREQADKAVGVLEQGLKELGQMPAVGRQIVPALERYRLVGTPAAPIEAPHWLNAPAGTTKADLAGKVTVVEFTSHWCAWCRRTYPWLVRLHNEWATKGVQVVFATQLWGFFEEQRSPTPEQEVEADRTYYVERHGVPFKVAIENQQPFVAPGTATKPPDNNFSRYKVGGIPQIVVIDRHGRIRLIVVGSDPSEEARIHTLVERLLAQ